MGWYSGAPRIPKLKGSFLFTLRRILSFLIIILIDSLYMVTGSLDL
jgi:hypothetical protein